MAKTQVADIFVPEVWEGLFIERTAELAKFGQGGLMQRTAEFDTLAAGPSTIAEMPFWQDISGAREVISDTTALTPAKIGQSKDRARIHNDAKAWSTNLLAELLAGDDPMERIVQLVGEYWARIDEDMLVAILKGILKSFDSEDGDPNLLDIAVGATASVTAANALTGETFIDAKQKLGDVKDRLTAIAMHSEVEADLLKQSLIDYIPDADGRELLPFFQGLRVITDDDLPKTAGSVSGYYYHTILFGNGAVARGFAPLNMPLRGGFGTQAVEWNRVTLNHDDVLVNRRRHLMHPRGVKWNEDNVSGDGGPTDTELAYASNWTRVFESKNIRIVGIKHNLLNAAAGGTTS
jgi:hypothetical protein